MSWLTTESDDFTSHVVPLDDDIIHEWTRNCVCAPTSEFTTDHPDGNTRWIHVHHSLDGREANE